MREVNLFTIRIVLYNAASVSSWCEVLSCNESELLDAIRVVGNSAKDVDEHLEKNKGNDFKVGFHKNKLNEVYIVLT